MRLSPKATKRAGGVMLFLAAACVAALRPIGRFYADGDLPGGVAIALFVLALVLAVLLAILGVWAMFRGRQREAATRGADVVLGEDDRAPVVYLRSFEADRFSFWSNVFGALWQQAPQTEEEWIQELFERVGPLVAIGKPGEELPMPGAARVYTGDAEWQERALELIRRARLVVLRAGRTKGLAWEVETTLKMKRPHEVVIYVGGYSDARRDAQDYEEFRRQVDPLLASPLPKKPRRLSFVTFDTDWAPHVAGGRRVPLRVALNNRFKKQFANPRSPAAVYNLRPVFERLGVEPPTPGPLPWYWIGFLAVTWTFLALLLVFGVAIVCVRTFDNVTIVDDGDAGFSTTGNWDVSKFGFGSDCRLASATCTRNSNHTATWTLEGARPGTYRISACWGASEHLDRSIPFRVLDDGKVVGEGRLDQTKPPDDRFDLWHNLRYWHDLGVYRIAGDSIAVEIRCRGPGSSNQLMEADAMRFERIGD